MVKKVIIGAMLVFASLTASAQYSAQSESIREVSPEMFQLIKEEALRKWKNDFPMVMHEVNKQSEAIVNMFLLKRESDYDSEIMARAEQKWGIDYVMQEHEYRKQLKSKKALQN